MAKVVKVRAYKKLGPTGKVEDVDAHMRKVKSAATKLATKILKSKGGNIPMVDKSLALNFPSLSPGRIFEITDKAAKRLGKS